MLFYNSNFGKTTKVLLLIMLMLVATHKDYSASNKNHNQINTPKPQANDRLQEIRETKTETNREYGEKTQAIME